MLVISDTHTGFNELFSILDKTSEKNVIMLGDHGFGEHINNIMAMSTAYLHQFYPHLTFYIIQGNHDNSEYMKNYRNVNCILSKNGWEAHKIEGKNCLFIPGAYSYDKALQLAQGTYYFDEEMKFVYFINLIENGPKVDLLFSHDTALDNYYRFYETTAKSRTNQALEFIYSNYDNVPKYHGHLHNSYTDGNTNGLGINESVII